MNILIFKILVVVFGTSGFLLARHIWHSKRKSSPLVCPLNGKCENVIHSKFSKLFGIPLEILGMAYYGLISVFYLLYSFSPQTLPVYASYIIMGITVTAFLFSIYLTLLQAVVIKSWCTWCLFSAGLCTLIFLLVFLISEVSIKELIGSFSQLI